MNARHVLPIHSPLSRGVIFQSAKDTVLHRQDAFTKAESLLRSEYRADDALLLGSGTHALELALSLGRKMFGGALHVALPAYTCYDVGTAAVGAGATISLFDLDPRSLAPDLWSLERALAAGARVVVVSPLYGIPVDWNAIEVCAMKYGALVIEDAAQGHGSTWHDRKLGSHGRLSVLSFGRGKGWTGGCGGALLARHGITSVIGPLSSVAPPRLGAFTGLARATAQWALGRNSVYSIPASVPWLHLGETRFHEPSPVRGSSRVAAHMMEHSFELASHEASARRHNAKALIAGLASVFVARRASRIEPVKPNTEGVAGYLRLPLLIDGGLRSNERARAGRLGIMPGYPATLADLPRVAEKMPASMRSVRLDGAKTLARDLVTLATHSLVTSSDLEAQLRFLSASGSRPD